MTKTHQILVSQLRCIASRLLLKREFQAMFIWDYGASMQFQSLGQSVAPKIVADDSLHSRGGRLGGNLEFTSYGGGAEKQILRKQAASLGIELGYESQIKASPMIR